jgi:hypothetical protein
MCGRRAGLRRAARIQLPLKQVFYGLLRAEKDCSENSFKEKVSEQRMILAKGSESR